MSGLDRIAEEALRKAIGRYTVSSENVERVVELVIDDVLREVGPEIELMVRGYYAPLGGGANG